MKGGLRLKDYLAPDYWPGRMLGGVDLWLERDGEVYEKRDDARQDKDLPPSRGLSFQAQKPPAPALQRGSKLSKRKLPDLPLFCLYSIDVKLELEALMEGFLNASEGFQRALAPPLHITVEGWANCNAVNGQILRIEHEKGIVLQCDNKEVRFHMTIRL